MNTRVAIADLPFGAKVREFSFPPGMTIEQMIAQIPEIPPHFQTDGYVMAGDQKVPRELWKIARPREGVQLSLAIKLSGGGGGSRGSKNVIALVAVIAIAAIALAVSAGALGPITGGFLAAGTFAAKATAAGIGLLGQLALNQLLQPQKQPDQSSSQLQPNSAALSANVLLPDGRLPRVIGTRKIFPPSVCTPLTSIDGDDQIVESVFALCGPHRIEEVKVGGVLLDDLFSEATFQIREGLEDDLPQDLVTRYGFDSAVNIAMQQMEMHPDNPKNALKNQTEPTKSLPQWSRVTSQAASDEIWLTMAFPEGTWNEDLNTRDNVMPIRIRFRLEGTLTWINGPEIHFHSIKPTLFRKYLKLIWGTWPGQPAVDVGSWAGQTLPPTNEGPIYTWWSVPTATATNNQTLGSWTADDNFKNSATINDVKNVSLFHDGVEMYIDEATFPKGKYEIELMASRPYQPKNFLTLTTYVWTSAGIIPDLFGFLFSAGQGWTPLITGDRLHYTTVLERVATVINSSPTPESGKDAVIAFRGKNRSFDSLSCKASGLVRTWDGENWSGYNVTSNPSPHFRDILTNSLFNEDPLPEDIVDDTSIIAWGVFCPANNLEVNFIAEQGSVQDALAICVGAGHGILKQSDTWGVAWEHDRSGDTIIQAFTPRNTNNYGWTKAFDKLPDGLIVTYSDATMDWADAQIIVYDDGVDSNTVTNLQSIRYEHVTNTAQVQELALLDMRRARLRSMFHEIDVPAEALVCQPGDLVAFQHDSLHYIGGFARIKSVTIVGPNITAVVLDSGVQVSNEPDMWAATNFWAVPNVWDMGSPPGVSIRKKNGTVVTKAISTATADWATTLTFTTPFADDGTIVAGNIVMVGPLAKTYDRMVLYTIQSAQDLTAKLVMLDEAPEILA